MKTDEEIKQDLLAQLEIKLGGRAKDVGVSVINGIVTLKGSVPNYAAKVSIVGAAERLNGVVALDDEITIHLPADQRRSDTELTAATFDVIKNCTNIPTGSIKISVQNGWLVLTGLLERWRQKSAVEDAVRQLTGLIGVTNLVSVSSRPLQRDAGNMVPCWAIKPDASSDIEMGCGTLAHRTTTVGSKNRIEI